MHATAPEGRATDRRRGKSAMRAYGCDRRGGTNTALPVSLDAVARPFLATSPAMIALPHDAPAAAVPTRQRVSVLFADDSSVARQSIAAFLRSLDHVELHAACENGRAAVEQALRDQPDAVLLDLQMPVMSGLEAAQILRSCLPETAVIIMTVHDHPEVRAASLAGGADAFVAKARLAREFEGALERALAAARAPTRHLTPQPGVHICGCEMLSSGAKSASVFPFTPDGAAGAKGSIHGSALPRGEPAPPFHRDP